MLTTSRTAAQVKRRRVSGRLPGNLDQAIFRIGAFAFCSLSTLALMSDHFGSGLQNEYPIIWALTALAYGGGALAWYLAYRRAPVELILPLAILGIALITAHLAVTGGTHSHVFALYVVPVIFTAALLEFRFTALVIVATIVGAAIPLFMSWDTAYARSIMILTGVMALTAYVETRLLRTAIAEKTDAEHQALHDDLTGLANRAFFYRQVQDAIRMAPNRPMAVLVMDLDRFKDINDTLGHPRGDLVLQELARRLTQAVGVGDIVARLGGDEFGIFVPQAPPEIGAKIVQRILLAIEQPVLLDAMDVDLRVSVGVALFPDHGLDVDALVRKADIALYQAKSAKGGYHVYRLEDDRYTTERLEMIGELRRAIEKGELVLHYQPEIDMQSRAVTGVEALVRWQHPRRGLLLPPAFIPLVEHSGLMKALTLHVLQAALRQCRAWHGAGYELSVAVNVAASDLLDLQFPRVVERMLAEAHASPKWLELEITEGTIMADPSRARQILTELHAQGIGLSVDDFGTGYSSLAYLRELPVDAVKIDRSFVTEIGTDASDAMIVRAIVDLGRNLGLRVIAEGVETEKTWNTLAGLGCDLAQGYFISPPVSEATLSLWLAKWSSDMDRLPGTVDAPARLRLAG